MSITVNQVANTNNWQVLFNAVNTLAGLLTANVVTADASANGSVTIGNSYFLGIFAVSNLVANTISGGNNTVTSTLNVGSNVAVNSSSQINIGAITINSSVITVGNVTINTTAISAPSITNTFSTNYLTAVNQLTLGNVVASVPLSANITATTLLTLDSFPLANVRSAEYSLSISDNAGNNYQFSKILLVTDGTSAYTTETMVQSGAAILTFSATTNATHVVLQAQTVSSTNTYIRGLRQGIFV